MWSTNRAVMNTLLGRKGLGCAAMPSPDELEGLKAAAAKAQEATLRYYSGITRVVIRCHIARIRSKTRIAATHPIKQKLCDG